MTGIRLDFAATVRSAALRAPQRPSLSRTPNIQFKQQSASLLPFQPTDLAARSAPRAGPRRKCTATSNRTLPHTSQRWITLKSSEASPQASTAFQLEFLLESHQSPVSAEALGATTPLHLVLTSGRLWLSLGWSLSTAEGSVEFRKEIIVDDTPKIMLSCVSRTSTMLISLFWMVEVLCLD